MAHIQDRGKKWRPESSRYRARFRGPDGKERSRCFTRRIDADRFLATTEAAKVRGDWFDPALGNTLLADWSARWLDGVRPTLKPTTVASYDSLLRSRILPTFGAHRLSTIRPSDVQTWIGSMVELKISASRIRQAQVVLSKMLGAAVRDGLVSRNVALGVSLPKLQREEAAYLEPNTVDAISQAMPEPLRPPGSNPGHPRAPLGRGSGPASPVC